jgi:DNA-binding NtrC family response regulator
MSSPSSSSSTPPSNKTLSSGTDVLVVEDDVRVRRMLADALKQMGFAASFAPTAEAAARILAAQAFDILILDLNLPGMGGIEFLESVRRQQNDIQVIILTGFGDLEAARKAIHFDVVEFLTKPCALGSLEVALSRARKRRKGQIVSEAAAAVEPVLQFDTPPTARPAPAEADETDPSAEGSMEEVERRHILTVLAKHNGNRAATAAELGISVRKLYYRLGEYQRKGSGP